MIQRENKEEKSRRGETSRSRGSQRIKDGKDFSKK